MGDLLAKVWGMLAVGMAFLGGSCFAALAPASFFDHATAVHYTQNGIAGTAILTLLLMAFRDADPDSEFLTLRRNIVFLIVGLAWGVGAAGGVAIFYVIPRMAGITG